MGGGLLGGKPWQSSNSQPSMARTSKSEKDVAIPNDTNIRLGLTTLRCNVCDGACLAGATCCALEPQHCLLAALSQQPCGYVHRRCTQGYNEEWLYMQGSSMPTHLVDHHMAAV